MGLSLITTNFLIASVESRMLRVRASLVDGARAIMGAMVSRVGHQKLCRTTIRSTQGETVPQQRQTATKGTRVCPVMHPQRTFYTSNAKSFVDLGSLDSKTQMDGFLMLFRLVLETVVVQDSGYMINTNSGPGTRMTTSS